MPAPAPLSGRGAGLRAGGRGRWGPAVLLPLRGRSAGGPQVPEASTGETALRGEVAQAVPFALGEPPYSPGIGMLMPVSLVSCDC